MLLQPSSAQIHQLSEDHQLGEPVERYQRFATLSGKIAFTGIFLLVLSLIEAIIAFVSHFDLTSSAGIALSLVEFCQGMFLVGVLLSAVRHEELITPLHPRLSVELYTNGLVYRKGSKIRDVRWEQIERVQRQCKVYRRKKKILLTRTGYLCEIASQPNLLLSAAITNVDEIGSVIERELTRRILPQIQADYQEGKSIVLCGLALTRQTITYRKKEVTWERVHKIEVGAEKLVVEQDSDRSDWLIVPLSDVSNLCILEALLENMQREKGFALVMAKSKGQSPEIEATKERYTQSSQKTSRVSSFLLAVLIVLVVSAETFGIIANVHHSQQQSASRFYPALISYSLHPTPQPGLPYSAETIYKAFLAAGIKAGDTQYADGWYRSATYQPEGKLVLWEESYGVVLEIATFATPIEAKTDASDLLKNSSGYSVYTRNLCLFFYDSSISDAHRDAYLAIIERICT